jgi:hypothetical protein
MRLLRYLIPSALVMTLVSSSQAGLILDDFSTDTSANYTPKVVLARVGSVTPSLAVTGGELRVTSVGNTSNVPTQTLIFHNTATLEVGYTLLVDVNVRGATYSNVSESVGLVVAAGVMPGLTLPVASNQDVRDDHHSFLIGTFRNQNGRDVYRTDGFTAVNGGTIGEANNDQGLTSSSTSTELDKIVSIYIRHHSENSYELGWVDDLDVTHLVRTINMSLGASPRVGLFIDSRSSTFAHQFDNFRIVPEPSTAMLSCLAGVGLAAMWRKKRSRTDVS